MNSSISPRRLFAFALFFLAAAQAGAASFTATALESLGGDTSIASGINNSGQIIGTSLDTDLFPRATLWSGGAPINAAPSYYISRGNAINDSGAFAGDFQSFYGRFPTVTAFASCCGDLSSLGVSDSVAYGMNNSGQIVGEAFTQGWAGEPLFPFPFYGTHAVLWDGATATDLNPAGATFSTARGINDDGTIAGSVDGNAVLWNDGSITTLGAGIAHDINNAGVAVGTDGSNALMWDGMTQTILGAGTAFAVNSLSQAVGSANGHATLWYGDQAIDLNGFLDAALIGAGWVLEVATGINDSGWIVANAFNINTLTHQAFVLSPVPEPSTWGMLLVGGALVAWLARRRAISGMPSIA